MRIFVILFFSGVDVDLSTSPLRTLREVGSLSHAPAGPQTVAETLCLFRDRLNVESLVLTYKALGHVSRAPVPPPSRDGGNWGLRALRLMGCGGTGTHNASAKEFPLGQCLKQRPKLRAPNTLPYSNRVPTSVDPPSTHDFRDV